MLSRAPLCRHKPRYWFGCYSTGTIEDKEISEIIINTIALIPCCFCATGICSRFFSGDPIRVARQGYGSHRDRLSYAWLLWHGGQHGQVEFFAIFRGLCGFFRIGQRFAWTVFVFKEAVSLSPWAGLLIIIIGGLIIQFGQE